jgi:cytochrome c oxidase accessory protein FixG
MSDAAEQSLYATQQKIYPREVDGFFARLRVGAVIVLLGLFYGVPWLMWSGHQAILFDLPARKFYILGLVLWPQDFYFLSWLLIMAALSLFFFTALAGRLWCGYACPQTVWTEIFLWMERWTEGRGAQRRKLDQAPWTLGKLARKSAKQALWISFGLWTGFTFVGYFTPIRALATEVASLSLGGWETFWILFYGFATYGNAGYMREQVCRYMCPYARFQSAMFDRDTLIISYDNERGEPRGSRRRGTPSREQGLGDCINCRMCVQVCPTGIDIREGLQYECIACAACIDACDGVMEKMGYAPRLIRYSTQQAMEGKHTRILRPRIFLYGAVLGLLAIGFVLALLLRTPLGMDVIRDRNSLYREVRGGDIENVYTLMVMNKDTVPHGYSIEVSGLETLRVETDPAEIRLAAGASYPVAARVRIEDGVAGSGGHDIFFRLTANEDPSQAVTERGRFFTP